MKGGARPRPSPDSQWQQGEVSSFTRSKREGNRFTIPDSGRLCDRLYPFADYTKARGEVAELKVRPAHSHPCTWVPGNWELGRLAALLRPYDAPNLLHTSGPTCRRAAKHAGTGTGCGLGPSPGTLPTHTACLAAARGNKGSHYSNLAHADVVRVARC